MLTAVPLLLILVIGQPGHASAQATLPFGVLVESRDDQLGTGTNDLSGATFNADRGRVLVVDNATNRIHEFDTDDAGRLVVGPRRTVTMTVGGGDLEGIAWIGPNGTGGDDYAVLSENTGVVDIVAISDDIGFTSIGLEHVVTSFATGVDESPDGAGAEGIALDPTSSPTSPVFWVVAEREPTLLRVDTTGRRLASVPVPLLDASGVFASPLDGTVFVVSDDSRQIVQLSIDTDADPDAATVVSTMDLPDFEQAEGITFDPTMTSLYVFGESPTNGLTYAQYERAAPADPSQPRQFQATIGIRAAQATTTAGPSATGAVDGPIDTGSSPALAASAAILVVMAGITTAIVLRRH